MIVGKRRVVITGMGVVAPNGIGKEAFWEALLSAKSGIKKITRFDASSYPCQIAGEVDGFTPYDFMEPKEAKRASRYAQFALVATLSAMEDSGLGPRELEAKNVGV